MSIVSTSAHTESPSEEQGDVVVHDRRVTVDGITAQYLEAAPGRRCCCCTDTSRARPAGGGSSPPLPGPTTCWP
jgi:hypothetical protein